MTEPRASAFDLADDHSGVKARALKEELLTLDMSGKRTMDAGLTPDDMKVAQAARDAVQAASRVVEALSR